MTKRDPNFDVMQMNGLVSAIAEETGFARNIVTPVVLALKEIILKEVESGTNVDLGLDFGRFENKETGPRVINIPNNVGKTLTDGKRKMVFKLSARRMGDLPLLPEKDDDPEDTV